MPVNLPASIAARPRWGGPRAPRRPVLLAVPHAGRIYPPALSANRRCDPHGLMRLEDRYADLLVANAATAGFTTITQGLARAWIDLNRAPDDVDPRTVSGKTALLECSPSAKSRGGLGLIPHRLAGHGDLWRRSWTAAEIAERIEAVHRPWHNAIADTLADMGRRFGGAVLIDVHSMPPLGEAEAPARVVIGDRFGRAASGRMSEAALGVAREHGLVAALNSPYPGGYTLDRHANPAANVHAVQVEIDRSCYLDAALREPGAGLVPVQRFIADLARVLDEELPSLGAIAAE